MSLWTFKITRSHGFVAQQTPTETSGQYHSDTSHSALTKQAPDLRCFQPTPVTWDTSILQRHTQPASNLAWSWEEVTVVPGTATQGHPSLLQFARGQACVIHPAPGSPALPCHILLPPLH